MGADTGVHQTIQCPTRVACDLYAPSANLPDSDFAICSENKPTETCDFYKGNPAKLLQGRTTVVPMFKGIFPVSPYQNVRIPEQTQSYPFPQTAWPGSGSDLWYFDPQGVLTILKADRSTAPVTALPWTPKDSACTGELSSADPRRFLAICIGAHFYSDGDLDAIFGYSRIALFDVGSRDFLMRLDGPAYTSAFLSPSGKLIATVHLGRLRLYRVD